MKVQVVSVLALTGILLFIFSRRSGTTTEVAANWRKDMSRHSDLSNPHRLSSEKTAMDPTREKSNEKMVSDIARIVAGSPNSSEAVLTYGKELDDLNGEQRDRVVRMDRENLEELVTILQNSSSLDRLGQVGVFNWIVNALEFSKPEPAVKLLLAHLDLVEPDFRRGFEAPCLPNLLGRRFAVDEAAGERLFEDLRSQRPDLLDPLALRMVVCGVSSNDPALAFKLLDQFGMERENATVSNFLSQIPSYRWDEALVSCRSWLEGLPDDATRRGATDAAMAAFATGLERQQESDALAWLEKNDFSEMEIESMTHGLRHREPGSRPSKLAEWLAAKQAPSAVR
jgi:hypothetical protein